jgi:hypothetical protein
LTVIHAAAHWEDEAFFLDLLDDLEALPSRRHVVLDLTPPRALLSKEDRALLDCFGEDDEPSLAWLVAQLDGRASNLKGLRLTGNLPTSIVALSALLSKFDTTTPSQPAVLPPEYATFEMLKA